MNNTTQSQETNELMQEYVGGDFTRKEKKNKQRRLAKLLGLKRNKVKKAKLKDLQKGKELNNSENAGGIIDYVEIDMPEQQFETPNHLEKDNLPQNPTEDDVIAYMKGNKGVNDRNERLDKVKEMHGGEYPSYWYSKITLSGIKAKGLD